MIFLQDNIFTSFWDLNMTLFNILRRFLQKKYFLTLLEVPLYDEYFMIIEYVRKSMRNNIMKIYQKSFI